ncbi:MAG: hypothetical protein IPL49_22125 [Saprospirales bacterium]|nr:hypothetical protein [Saprospirales bacterium]
MDAPVIIENFPLLSKYPNALEKPVQSKVVHLAGFYQCFHLSSDKRSIHHSPIEIKPNGDVIIDDRTAEEKAQGIGGHIYFGKAFHFCNAFLALSIRKRDDEDFHPHLLFHVASYYREQVSHFHGVSTSITSKNTLRASREVLMKMEGNFETEHSSRIPIPLNGKEEPLYDKLNEEYDGLANFLTGNAHNLIVPKRDPNSPFERQENYGMLYFSSACYFAANNDPQNARKQLERASSMDFEIKSF